MKGDHQRIAGVESCNDAVLNRLSIQLFLIISFHSHHCHATSLVYPPALSCRNTPPCAAQERSSSSSRGIWFHDVRNCIRHLNHPPRCPLERNQHRRNRKRPSKSSNVLSSVAMSSLPNRRRGQTTRRVELARQAIGSDLPRPQTQASDCSSSLPL